MLSFPGLGQFAQLAHAITTVPWNMAPHRGPQRELAVERRRIVCERLGLPFERLTAPDQIHSHHVVAVQASDVGAGRDGRDSAVRFVDGLVCDLRATPLIQLSADCPLVIVFDPDRPAFGSVHASWRGTLAGIAGRLVERMAAAFDSRPDRLWAAVAPCAGRDRYAVGPEVLRVARTLLPDADRFFPRSADALCFDLKAANVDQLIRSGLSASRIEVADVCTISDRRFFSHRREGANTGRFALIAGIRA